MAAAHPTFFTYATPVGHLTIASDGTSITELAFGVRELSGEKKPSELTNRAANQLQEYFAGKRTVFDLPLDPHGTPFQKRVWTTLLSIPYGQTQTYGDVAQALGDPNAVRAVGAANNRNPLPILIPCHRVVAANGNLGGWGGDPKAKAFLLDLERKHADSRPTEHRAADDLDSSDGKAS
ncbi:methylated-DNA--[protein]-cysteine S-methyltransferase [Raoultibacter phocaeensis]|uniref:methylated-DNA--[protein]-cysteine S-methyltransferase n=1 Tax=Raoultibacter phocaeensis TaxID=2479841 RepID=UPI0011191BDA|nr:methylated-DNA--[protein]-cysteine S-methyltransferase [Raoultibacter phocaeensis]